ncbi:hypothetical protein [Paraburkholderia diazotrophica]|uniref:O-Antigen ligase n=1 Tax=Paraburkholderia diazotrophica TaxID=667676 RepID=A0A1H6QAX7_9BURK|nr:hypothetical protein [Paraburkholderia diazotrophica]SEI40893.1 hypothetical protein SAMN05192539_1001222 [Paraburkholderia diazotrophica]
MAMSPPPTRRAPGAPRAAPRSLQRRAGARVRAMRKTVLVPIGLFVLSIVLIAVHLARPVEFLFPLGSLVIGYWLYRKSPPHYVGFVCWLFFLSPWLRRLADFVNGSFNDKSMIMMAPLLAVALCGLSLITGANTLGQRRNAPLILIVVGLMYGFIVGVAQTGFGPAVYTLVNWLFPPLVAFYLNVTWQHYPDYQRVLLRTAVYGGLVMGVYGVIQYVVVPPWDLFWLIAVKITSFGKPVPYGLRVWSTMNSPGPFAVTIMYLLQISLASREFMRIPMMLSAASALLFTSVRSCWGGLVIGLVYPVAMLDGRSRLKLLCAVVGVAALCSPVMMFDQVSDGVLKRMQTMSDISNDNSFQSRQMLYEAWLSAAFSNISGDGLGSTGLGTKLSSDPTKAASPAGTIDSGILEVPTVLGWPGSLLYVGGILMLMWRAFLASIVRSKDRLAICGAGVSLAIFAMMAFTNTLVGVTGMFYFIGVMLPVIGLRHARRTAHAAKKAAARTPAPAAPAAAMARTARSQGQRAPLHGGATPLYKVRL